MNKTTRGLLASMWLMGLSGCGPDAPTPAERLAVAGEDAALLLETVREAEEAGRLTFALAAADSLVQIAPELPDGHFYRGFLLFRLYQLDAADSAFVRAAELDPFHRAAFYHRGHVAFEKGRYTEAARRYLLQTQVIEESPRAIKEFYEHMDRTVLEQAWLQAGRSWQLLNTADSARLAYEHVLESDSMHAQANSWLAELYDVEGDTDRALEYANRAWQQDRENPEFAYKAGSLLFKLGKLDQALPPLEWSVAAEPWNAGAHYNLGRLLVALGRTEEGRRHLARTDALQDLDQEIDMARAAAARFPGEPARWREVARLLERAGRTREQYETMAIARAVAHRSVSMPDNSGN